jgi:hypothetical protein
VTAKTKLIEVALPPRLERNVIIVTFNANP